MAEKSVELSAGQNLYCLSTLGAAYAESGDFRKAIEAENRALEHKAHEKSKGKTGREFIKLYEQKKPVRMPSPKK